MTGRPLVSVLMPVFNGARFLPEALRTVAAQTYSPVEVIFVDGPSTDATPEIARAFPGARYFRQRGTGMWSALNEGIAAARGELICILSHDDLWTPDKLELQVDTLLRHPEVDYVGAVMRFVAIAGEPLPPSFRRELLDQELPSWCPEAMMIRATLFERLGGFDERHQIAADIDWLARARDAGAIARTVPRLLLYKRIHAQNLSTLESLGTVQQRELLRIMRDKLVRLRQSAQPE